MVLSVIRVTLGLLFAAFGFVTWPSQLASLTNWSSVIVTSMLSLMALAALTIIVERDQIGAHEQGAVRLRAELPDLHAELCADLLPGHLLQGRMEADRA